MSVEMEHLKAPKENIQTWHNVMRLFTWAAVGCAIILLLMAAFLV